MQGRKLRILALHGFRENASRFRGRLRGLLKRLGHAVDIDFVEAPHILPCPHAASTSSQVEYKQPPVTANSELHTRMCHAEAVRDSLHFDTATSGKAEECQIGGSGGRRGGSSEDAKTRVGSVSQVPQDGVKVPEAVGKRHNKYAWFVSTRVPNADAGAKPCPCQHALLCVI